VELPGRHYYPSALTEKARALKPALLRTRVTGCDGASIRFQALIEHILVGIEAGCDEEMLLRFGEQDVMIGRIEREAVRPRRMSDNAVSFTGRGQDGGTHNHRVPRLAQKAKLDRPEE
jgi:hypothetical protein